MIDFDAQIKAEAAASKYLEKPSEKDIGEY